MVGSSRIRPRTRSSGRSSTTETLWCSKGQRFRGRIPAITQSATVTSVVFVALTVFPIAPAAEDRPAVSDRTGPTVATLPDDFAGFQREIAPALLVRHPMEAKHWRQIEPAVYALARAHAHPLAAMNEADRLNAMTGMAALIDRRRAATADLPVLAPGRRVIGLLDPARGLDPEEITTIAAAYGSKSTIFKQERTTQTLAEVAEAFLAEVAAASAEPKGTTIVVLGHGLPTEIQSYGIRFERLVEALLSHASTSEAGDSGKPRRLDLGGLVLICDDCFSADFLANVLTGIEDRCRQLGIPMDSLPTCIAGTNHGRIGHATVGQKFVPHFWRDVIELFYVRRPHPTTVTLSGFFERVDGMMYGYGRVPEFDGSTVIGWRLVDPDMVQDPVVFVPLTDEDLLTLRRLLELPDDVPLPRWLDIG
jgi:hypothetical protein